MARLRAASLGFIGAVTLVIGVIGCQQATEESSPPYERPPRPNRPPIPLAWDAGHQLKSGVASATFVVTQRPGDTPFQLEARFSRWPPGTAFLLGNEQARSADGDLQTSIDIRAAVLAQPLDALPKAIDLRVGIGVAPPGHDAAATMLPAQDVRGTLRLALMQAEHKGLSFGAADTGVTKPRGAAVIWRASELEFAGSAKTAFELDWVAIAKDQKEPHGRKVCHYEQARTLAIRFLDANVVLFDRRTGKPITSAVIKKREECPKLAWANKDDVTTTSSPSMADFVAWTNRQLVQARQSAATPR